MIKDKWRRIKREDDMKNWKGRAKKIIILILEAGFCIYLAWVMINGFIACPSALNQKEIFCYLICCVILSGVVSGGLFWLLRYIESLEKNLENLEDENNRLRFSLKIMGKGNKTAKEESKKKQE